MPNPNKSDSRKEFFVDIDRMVNEGLGGGNVSHDNGLIEDTTSNTLKFPESVIESTKGNKENKNYH